jgi:precorrin-2 dehydrogenase/sirohydrochlorin ferrochelatase
MKTYPVCLIDLENRRCVVVGGGKIALRKTIGLLDAGAIVTIISPNLEPSLQSLAQNDSILWEARKFEKGDLVQAFLVIAATNDSKVNQAIWEEACIQGSLINVVDDPSRSNFILPAMVKRGEIQIAISTGGSSPALARRLREKLETIITPEYEQLAEILAELRPELIAHTQPGESRLQAALALVDAPILEIIRLYGKEGALRYARSKLIPAHLSEKD